MSISRPPVLEGGLREEAAARLAEISRALAQPYDEWTLSRRPDDTGLRSVSLALGRAGLAVFFAWLWRADLESEGGAVDHAVRLLEESIELLPSHSMDASFLCGFPGVAWTTEHVLGLLAQTSDDDPNADVDDAILAALADPTFVPAYDLIDGLAGHGVYALERRGRDTAVPMMSAILGRLEATACPQRAGLSWPSGMNTRTAQGKDVPVDERFFNLGLSHGVPGVIGILARFAAVPEVRDRALALLRGVTTWMREQRLPAASTGAFGDFVADGVESEPARVAWCYGDPGVAASLLAAARALDNDDLAAFALDVAHVAARRDVGSSGVVDAGLCHGSAGVAHIFHRLYRATGDATCRDAARRWFEHLLRRETDRPNVAGFATFCFERAPGGEYIEDPAWLTGAAGVGLVLISALGASALGDSALSDSLPTWDRPLLLDLDW
jgi:lantibiotic modifying enzyme